MSYGQLCGISSGFQTVRCLMCLLLLLLRCYAATGEVTECCGEEEAAASASVAPLSLVTLGHNILYTITVSPLYIVTSASGQVWGCSGAVEAS